MWKKLICKSKTSLWLSLLEEGDQNGKDEMNSKVQKPYTHWNPKAHPTSELITVMKCFGHALRCLAFSLANVVREGGKI